MAKTHSLWLESNFDFCFLAKSVNGLQVQCSVKSLNSIQTLLQLKLESDLLLTIQTHLIRPYSGILFSQSGHTLSILTPGSSSHNPDTPYPSLLRDPFLTIQTHLIRPYSVIFFSQGIGIKGKEMVLVQREKASRTALQTSSVNLTQTLLVQTHKMTTVKEIAEQCCQL